MSLNTLQGGGFADVTGVPLANGYLTFSLSHDEQDSGGPHQVVGGLVRKILLDNNGNAAGSQTIENNDTMAPSGSYYTVNAYASDGRQVWRSPQYVTVVSTSSPFNLGSITPTQPPGSGLENEGLTLQTNGVNNSDQNLLNLQQGANVTLTNVDGTTTISASGGGGSSLPSGACLSSFGQYGIGDDVLDTALGGNDRMVGVANQVQVYLLVVTVEITVSTATIFVFSNSGSATEVGVGLYNSTGNLIIDGSAIATLSGSTTYDSAFSISFSPVTLTPGLYWVGQTCPITSSLACAGWLPLITTTGSASNTAPYRLANAVSVKTGVAGNSSIGGGAMPSTLGGVSAFTVGQTTGGPILILFQ